MRGVSRSPPQLIPHSLLLILVRSDFGVVLDPQGLLFLEPVCQFLGGKVCQRYQRQTSTCGFKKVNIPRYSWLLHAERSRLRIDYHLRLGTLHKITIHLLPQ